MDTCLFRPTLWNSMLSGNNLKYASSLNFKMPKYYLSTIRIIVYRNSLFFDGIRLRGMLFFIFSKHDEKIKILSHVNYFIIKIICLWNFKLLKIKTTKKAHWDKLVSNFICIIKEILLIIVFSGSAHPQNRLAAGRSPYLWRAEKDFVLQSFRRYRRKGVVILPFLCSKLRICLFTAW